MNYTTRLCLILLNLLTATGSFAFIYEVKVLRKWDSRQRKYLYFIGLSDFHDKTHPINKDHLAQIERILQSTDRSISKVLIEDLSTANASGKQACGRFFVNSRGGVLGGLAQTTQNMGHETDNVEFRYCRVTSLGPVLNNIGEDVERFPSVTSTPMAVLTQEIADVIKEITAYNDGPGLKVLYDSSIQEIRRNLNKLHFDQDDHGSVAQYLKKHSTQANRMDLLKLLLTFDSGLLDLKMVHSVVNAPEKSKVIAIAGGAHISRACEILQKIGYEPVKITQIAYVKEHDLQRCLGSHIVDGAFCVKPQPINIDFVDAIIKQK
jgi:hypothetical protein